MKHQNIDQETTTAITKKKILRKYNELISALISYAKKNNQIWNKETAEENFTKYLDINGITIITHLTYNKPLQECLNKGKSQANELFIVASFILSIEKEGKELFDYFDSIAQGNMLASSIYLPDSSKIKKKLTNCKFFMDTSLILAALGHEGEDRQKASTDLIDLIRQNNGRVYCFESNILETERALTAIAANLSTIHNTGQEAYGRSGEHFRKKGFNDDDVLLLKNRVRSDVIEKAKFHEIINIEPIEEYTKAIDVKFIVKNFLKQKTINAQLTDINAINSILTLRKG